MATIAFPNDSATVKLPSGVKYSYVYIPAKASKPTIIFLHGFPSSSYDWRHQITYFSLLGYGVLAPDLLGYGETDQPASPADYRGKKMAAQINELLEHVKLSKVHGVSHDWGSFLLSRLANYYPEKLLSSSFLAVAYRPPGQYFDLDAVNKLTQEKLGYVMYGYWNFFNKEDAGQIVKHHIESFESILYTGDPSIWREHLAPLGAVEAFARSGKLAPKADWISDEEVATHRRIMNNEYGPAMNWYKRAIRNLDLPDEEEAKSDPNLYTPVLMLIAKLDPLSNTLAINAMKQYAENLKIVEIEAAHWLQVEKKDEVNAALEEFFESN